MYVFYVQEIGRFRAYTPYCTEREHIDSFMAVYTLKGSGKLIYHGEQHLLRPNDLFLIDCRDYQRYESAGDDGWEFWYLHFNGPAAAEYYKLYRPDHFPVTRISQDDAVIELFHKLFELQKVKSIRTEALSSQLITELLTTVLWNGSMSCMGETKIPDHIYAIQRQLDRHYSEKISLDRLAREHARSKFVLSREFKQYTGFSLHEYLINIRITAAKNLLKSTDITIAEIALAVGIENPSHFINLFKAREGLTPLAYRRQWGSLNPKQIRT